MTSSVLPGATHIYCDSASGGLRVFVCEHRDEVGEIRWSSDSRVEARFEVMFSPTCCYRGTYILEKIGGKWIVKGIVEGTAMLT